jgi:hypothetical protein
MTTTATDRAAKVRRILNPGEPDTLELTQEAGKTEGQLFARAVIDPTVRHASTAAFFASQSFGTGRPSMMASAEVLAKEISKVEAGDIGLASRLLASQAVTLDALFIELARRSGSNMGDYPQAMERYMRLALKAQSNCRATLEAMAKLHQPREQTVRHVHVNEGGQAVIADQFHHHGGLGYADSDKQSHAPRPPGASPTGKRHAKRRLSQDIAPA